MNSLAALAWKEWRESRWVLAVAAVAFIALPLAAGAEQFWQYHHFDFAPFGWEIWAGGILGTIAAAFATARDLRGKVWEFWTSRPVGVYRGVLVKFAIGLGVLLLACLLPLGAQAWIDAHRARPDWMAARLFRWLPFLWIAQYSVGFACGSLTRRTGPAIVLALALTLLGYCLPIVLPAWGFGDLPDSMDHPRARFVALMLGVSLVMLAIAVAAVRWKWHLRAGHGLMYWSIASVFVLLFASAAFQLASNLPVLQQLDLGDHEWVTAIHCDGTHGLLVTRIQRRHEPPAAVRAFDVTPAGVRLGPVIPLANWHEAYSPNAPVWLPKHPDVCFLIRQVRDQNPYRVELLTMSVRAPEPPRVTPIGTSYDANDPDMPSPSHEQYEADSRLSGWGDTLLANWGPSRPDSGSAVIDVADPMHPRIIRTGAPVYTGVATVYPYSEDRPEFNWLVPQVPGVPAEARLMMGVQREHGRQAALGDRLLAFTTKWNSRRVGIYKLTHFEEEPATPHLGEWSSRIGHFNFERIGTYDPSSVEQLFGGANSWNEVTMGKGLVYLSGMTQWFVQPLCRVTVLSVRDPAHPRPAGHFAIPSDQPLSVCPLPDGRALIGGARYLSLVGPPPGPRRAIARANSEDPS